MAGNFDYFKRDAEKALKNELSHSFGDIGKAEGMRNQQNDIQTDGRTPAGGWRGNKPF